MAGCMRENATNTLPSQSLATEHGDLSTSNAPIKLDKFTSTVDGHITTSNGPISGFYYATNSLLLRTSNAPVLVDVHLNSTKAGSAATLDIRTSNK